GVRAREAVRPAAARGGLGRRGRRAALAARAPAPRPGPREPAVARARVPVQARADPGGRLPDARDRPGSRASRQGGGLARGGIRGTRGRGGRVARAPLARGGGRGQGGRLPAARRGPGPSGESARQEGAEQHDALPLPRAPLPLLGRPEERHAIALVLFKLALAFHMSLRFAEANEMYQRAFDFWTPPAPAEHPNATGRIATGFLPNDPDPRSAIAWPNIQLCMELFDRLVEACPERTIVPSLAERWEISDDGLRYVFHLREGLQWSDGTPLTAHDWVFGIRRMLAPDAPGSSVAIYFVLENGQDFYLRRNEDADAIGVRALDDRTVEFRLAAPAPYLMGGMNRPDGGPQPRHAIERDGDAWTAIGSQVVSGAFRIASRTDDLLLLERRPDHAGPRPGNAARGGGGGSDVADAIEPYARDELDLVTV